ncbi:CCA tRNA nucleotidyltransferase [Rhodalgimonas zhirmunskyi]|uniref:CCA tRNA nucleotidyltransferase n=1 Tax=Rhodalgimonas zhirmunskyi TaxID=2964767 RepID=A0AAJ1U746_9RHOB|nr:CCA tRNA nucleotidyltransferase [Rhodoalgimonas zhirmunskyi]MDQ2094235.1 CCA tRNA nucleotidyltransferase [Rhodoalgimonas zhirmunskyi]
MKVAGEWLSNSNTQAVCRALTGAGHQALFVGGCVRNALLGAPVSDIDIATDATPETVSNICKAAGFKVVPTGFEHGTVTVINGGIPHEITTFRHDVETDGRHATVAFSREVEDDARRRDFTMNALYADAMGQVIDPLGGLPDLESRRVRFIEDPAQRIEEDYLRILRFFRFHAWYGDDAEGLDPEGLAAIATHLDGLERLSRERVGAEVLKLLRAPDPAPSVAAMDASGVLPRILPGASPRGLGLLIHFEQQQGVDPDPLRRLAVLGGDEPSDLLRLSKKQSRTLSKLREGMASMTSATELGYRHGAQLARSILLLRAALFETPPQPSDFDMAELGAKSNFPIKPADLMPTLQGPDLGRRLAMLEQEWIASGFLLTREELLNRI